MGSKQILIAMAVCAATLCTLAIHRAEPQTAAANGSLKGMITDPAGSVVSGADVLAVESATGHNLEIIGEAENLFNHTNAACGVGGCAGAVVNRFGASDFLRVTSATNSRQI